MTGTAASAASIGRREIHAGLVVTLVTCTAFVSGASRAQDSPYSILVTDRLELGAFDALPVAPGYSPLLEMLALPAIVGVEESGGFSVIDPVKVSFQGTSVLWTAWAIDGIDFTDPFFSGAPALRLPMRFLSSIAVRRAESAAFGAGEAIELETRDAELGGAKTIAAAGLVLPQAGGIFTTALTRTFSTTHPSERTPAPPDARRIGAAPKSFTSAASVTALWRSRSTSSRDTGDFSNSRRRAVTLREPFPRALFPRRRLPAIAQGILRRCCSPPANISTATTYSQSSITHARRAPTSIPPRCSSASFTADFAPARR
jgi:hypothetical protein